MREIIAAVVPYILVGLFPVVFILAVALGRASKKADDQEFEEYQRHLMRKGLLKEKRR